jgi:hypothetical protein
MLVDKVWKLTNTSRVGLVVRSSHSQRQFTFPDNVCGNFFSIPRRRGMKKTKTGEGDKGKRGRIVSDDAGGKSLSETSTSVCGQCVGENSTGVKSTVIHTRVNIFEVSKRSSRSFVRFRTQPAVGQRLRVENGTDTSSPD